MKNRRLTQFSLRTLLLLMTVCCVAMGSWTLYVQPYRQQAQAVALIEKCKGSVVAEAAQGAAWERWLVTKLLGQNQYVRVTIADLRKLKMSPEALQSLRNLRFLETLYLDHTDIEDSHLAGLTRLQQLKKLSLRYTVVTDDGIQPLGQLSQLETLYLTGTKASDTSISGLVELTHLRQLFVRWTGITLGGAERLQKALPECEVHHHELVAVE